MQHRPGGSDRDLVIEALLEDPDDTISPAAQTTAHAIPSYGINLNAVLYVAAGSGPHPTVLLLHGLPGNEQNLDCAQSIRRAGWNVLTIHYRGSWGSPGAFTLAHCLEDADAAIDWLCAVAHSAKLPIAARRIVLIGHSMGGFIAAHIAARRHDIRAAGLISAVDLGQAFGCAGGGRGAAAVDGNVGISAGLHILAGSSSELLAAEARLHAMDWRLADNNPCLAGRPLLVVSSDDGFASASEALAAATANADKQRLTQTRFSTDHSYSGCRIALQKTILTWLAGIIPDLERLHRPLTGRVGAPNHG